MTTQKRVFLDSEGDGYFIRNAAKLAPREDDPVLAVLRDVGITATAALEIGCANGHRLVTLGEALGCSGAGIDPSRTAIEAGKAAEPALDLRVGTADVLPFDDAVFDLVIFGFCLYLVDPALHLRAAAEADRVLRDGGHLVILDFVPPVPYANDYSHVPGMKAHKMAYAELFTAHPGYSLVHRMLLRGETGLAAPDDRVGVDLLAKRMAAAFPANPYRGG